MLTQWLLSIIYATLDRIPPVVWDVLHVIADILLFWLFKLFNYLRPHSRVLYHKANKEVENCDSYEEWREKAAVVDEITGANLWRRNFYSGRYDFRSLLEQYGFLQKALEQKDLDAIRDRFSTTGPCMLRNFAGIVDRRLFTKSLTGTKLLIELYLEKVIEGLDLLDANATPTSFFQRCKLSLGTTALILQGGSLFGMFHLGVIKGLLCQNLVPNVICGSSMGSSVAALFGCLSNQELSDLLSGDILETLKNDIGLLKSCGYGNMDQHLNLGTLIQNLIHHGYSQDVYLFIQFVCKYIVKDLTFEEAFQSTGKSLSIVIHATDKSCCNLLNYVTAPNVLIRSAINCSLGSGVISEDTQLLCKNLDNKLESFLLPEKAATCKFLAPEDANIVEESESPYQRLTELFNVNNFILSLARPYLAPLVVNDLKHEIKTSEYYYYKHYSDPTDTVNSSDFGFPHFNFIEMEPLAFKLKYHLERKLKNIVTMEFRHRMEVLDNLGLLCSWVKRLTIDEKTPRYATEITIVPRIKSLSPTRIIEGQLENIPYRITSGERSTWPVLSLIKTRCSVEFKLDQIIRKRRSKSNSYIGQ
ncbi:TGL3 (YMR313C) [Zygosaccharomyces parabailii]|uniref:ZYBA0S03-01354g1_1 n=1 Tax=Zygosaccharomyces bailii (strain CLIB 213 / ATCC 58445 / CBS 680 / BCRC 21525 / NBRC 1098 / NCYC 1416 / NRRL Y-2227) TaxID=1333698 RepID=A0A8J2X9P2_ZYGB2|nr:TGL3 (YMR313C) [Zygosaccharomyces parabailii]CDF88761.1 ZYBA0S03-01354g1_1 [Zygosaccharomyces bailii CLIB 213]